MKKTYVTTMPDHVGAFLLASRTVAELGLNITRVSYNKAIDLHTLFLEVEGEPAALSLAARRLSEIGYLPSGEEESCVLLTEFDLIDIPGSVTKVLELIAQYRFNISYLSSQENGSGRQTFKMGLFVENPTVFSEFLKAASSLCPVRVLDYDKAEKILDNSVFYVSFANELAAKMGLPESARKELVIDSNLLMQCLDEKGEQFHKTFDYIRQFGETLSRYRGDAFHPRISEHPLAEDLRILLIEPPCGSNTTILCHQGEYLYIDTGYACYSAEMLDLFRRLIPDFDTAPRAALITHADVDHCGLLNLFDRIYLSRKSRFSLLSEVRSGNGLREQNPLHAPYIRICKTLTSYQLVNPEALREIGQTQENEEAPLLPIGMWQFGELCFELWEGGGGHLPGELVLIDRQRRIAFTGDILINMKEMTPEQAAYNRYAPYLMSGVDTDSSLCAAERKELAKILGAGKWSIFGGHGYRKEWEIQ